MPHIDVYDTTLRDGSQGEGVHFSLQDKLLITKKLDQLGVDFIEGGYPLSNPKDAEYFREVRHLGLEHAKVAAFGMTRRKGVSAERDLGLQALLDSQAEVLTLVGKTWDLHARDVLGVSLDENLAMIAESIAYLRRAGRTVFYDAEHFFDGFASNPEYALETVRVAEQAGAAVVILCDTNGGTLPDVIADRVRRVRQVLSVPIGIHCHNDSDVAVANTLAAVAAGATQVQGTMNGVGERCGNTDLVSTIANLALKMDCDVLKPGRLQMLTEAARYVYEIANLNCRDHQPFVGRSAFAHKGGMHVHAIHRNTATYEHIDPELVGNSRRILVSELSGKSNILAKTAHYSLADDPEAMTRILARVCDMENQGYEFEAAEASFDILVKKVLGRYQPWFERLEYHVTVESDAAGQSTTVATVKIRIQDAVEHTVCEGDGPVNALDGALRKATARYYPQLDQMRLVDYKVRVVNGRAGTAARVRVVIESEDHDEVWGTVGVSENVIEASWLALVDSFEYKLFKDAAAQGNALPSSNRQQDLRLVAVSSVART